MAERIPENACCPDSMPQNMSIRTKKITDSCRDKDCIEDLRVYLTTDSQTTLDSAAGAKVRCADLLYAAIDVEPVTFDRNHYCIDITFYYRILADATVGTTRPVSLNGLVIFSKRVVLCGEDSRAHVYSSQNTALTDGTAVYPANLPTAVVEVLDPMVLASKVVDVGDTGSTEQTVVQIPDYIKDMFDGDLVLSGDQRRMFVSLGQFSIVRLERDAQIVIPVSDYAIPCRECCDNPGCIEDPCDIFSRIPFPAQQFTPSNCNGNCDGNNGYITI